VGQESTTPAAFDLFTYEPGGSTGWAHVGSGIWQKTITDGPKRVWSGVTNNAPWTVTGRGALCMATSGDTVGTNTGRGLLRRWFWGTGSTAGGSLANQLTMYTGSTTVAPPDHYGGLAFAVTTKGNAGVIVRTPRNWQMSDLVIHGGGGSQQLASTASTDTTSYGAIFERIHCRGASKGSAFGWNTAGATSDNTEHVFDDCIADNLSSASEDNDTSSGWGANNGWQGSDISENMVVKNCTVRGGFRHSGLQSQSDGTATREVGRGVTFQDCIVDGVDSDYMHPVDIDAEGWLVKNVLIRNFTGRCQIGGRHGLFIGNQLINGRECVQSTNIGVDQGVQIRNWDSPDYRYVENIRVENNLLNSIYGAPIRIYVEADPVTTLSAVGIVGNTIIDLDRGSRSFSLMLESDNTATYPLPQPTLRNNIFVTTSTTPIREETAAGVFTDRGENGLTGASGNKRYSTFATANLDGEYRPLNTTTPGSGTQSGYAMDATGRARPNPPTVGWKEPRYTRQAR